MDPLLLSSSVIAALISSVVSAVGLMVSYLLARRTLKAQSEGVRQVQMTEILKKKIETYPALYELISVFGRNWGIEGKRRDHEWARSFLKALVENNAKNGAFFSEKIYDEYTKLRTTLEHLTQSLAQGREATEEEMEQVFYIIRGETKSKGKRQAGLGTFIKDELGSYVTAIVSSSHGDSRATHLVPKKSPGRDR